ncbi:hypothetical protein DSO57_1030482 [Entomophthora muscae]|uniref:Uncharacterized protein n=2 Tax=Entomophthora muscae TaxID=34485 RepID=A0ACC2T0Z0_9FUNG|nr:hypothetical protein DSO57_1030482 [Entomophthora muscae]
MDTVDEFLGSGLILVEYWHSQCHACTVFMFHWDSITTQAQLPIKFGTINCKAEPSLCRSIDVVPKLVLYSDGNRISSFNALDFSVPSILDYLASEAEIYANDHPPQKTFKLCTRKQKPLFRPPSQINPSPY